MIEYLQHNEIKEYEAFVKKSEGAYIEEESNDNQDEIVITERYQHRFEAQARVSIRQNSNQHFFHKQAEPFFEPDGAVTTVTVTAFQPKQRFAASFSPEPTVHNKHPSHQEESKQHKPGPIVVRIKGDDVKSGNVSPMVSP